MSGTLARLRETHGAWISARQDRYDELMRERGITKPGAEQRTYRIHLEVVWQMDAEQQFYEEREG